MSLTAAITLASASLAPGQGTIATLAVTNSGISSAVTVTAIDSFLTIHSTSNRACAAAAGMANYGPGNVTSVPANSAINFYFPVTATAPQVPNTNIVYDVQATVHASDGSTTSATTATLTVTDPALTVEP